MPEREDDNLFTLEPPGLTMEFPPCHDDNPEATIVESLITSYQEAKLHEPVMPLRWHRVL